MLLGQLVDEGRLSWDDPVVRHIPEFRLFDDQLSSTVTIRDLLAHRTGIPRHDAVWFCRNMTRSEIIPCLQHFEPVCGLRERWYYNNFLYAIAGIVVERVTGQSWEEALHTRIFSSLIMTGSDASQETFQEAPDAALPYAEIEGALQSLSPRFPFAVEPAGAIHSNIEDMLKWLHVHLGSQTLVRTETLKEMHSVQIPLELDKGAPMSGYGLGWFVGEYKGHPFICHGGSIDGYNAEVFFVPQKNLGIVILTNSSTDGFFAIASIRNTILDTMLGTSKDDWISQVHLFRNQAKEALNTPKEHHPYPGDTYVGIYDHPAYGRVRIYSENDRLFASYGDDNRKSVIPLNHIEGHTFKGRIRELLAFGIHFPIDANFSNNAVALSFDPDAKPILFTRVE